MDDIGRITLEDTCECPLWWVGKPLVWSKHAQKRTAQRRFPQVRRVPNCHVVVNQNYASLYEVYCKIEGRGAIMICSLRHHHDRGWWGEVVTIYPNLSVSDKDIPRGDGFGQARCQRLRKRMKQQKARAKDE